jgi:catechol 2,3-dioxygenase-like lactoylglutathione lyase family enzyme
MDTIPDEVRRDLKLPPLGQIGYVVSDVRNTVDYCKDALGIRPWLLMEERPDPCIERGRVVHPQLKIALAYVGSVQVELIQVLEGETYHRDNRGRPESAVHHVGFMVRDLDRRLDSCREMGVDIIQRGTIREMGIKVDYAYLDTVDRAGVVIELVQWRLGMLPMPVNEATFKLACRVGASTLFRGRVVR